MFSLFGVNAINKAIETIGTQTALAKAINVVPQVVNNWIRRGNVPANYCPSIERATNGAVTCEDLRPDVDWGYLRATRCGQKEPVAERCADYTSKAGQIKAAMRFYKAAAIK